MSDLTQQIELSSAAGVHVALTTLSGLRAWWTPMVTGDPTAGGTLQFGFPGLDEQIVMRVDEATPTRVAWTCLTHTGAPEWRDSVLTFDLEPPLTFRHTGIAAAAVEPGWRRFLASLADYVDTGVGAPFGVEALHLARAYHAAWTRKDFPAAAGYLAADLAVDVPVNSYAGKADFVQALTGFGSTISHVDMLAELGDAGQAVLLYDLHSAPFGTIRIAEHFTVQDGKIVGIRHVHDTAPFQAMT